MPRAARQRRPPHGAFLLRAIAAAALAAATGCRGPRPETTEVGQWVWSRADASIFAAARHTRPALVPGVWVSTIAARGGAVEQRLALSPAAAGAPEVALVVRFDPSFTEVWATADDSTIARALDDRMTAMLRAAAPTGVAVREVQLDYDCPERLLPRWARVAGGVAGGALRARPVWVTSLVAHVRVDGYGDHFRGRVAGHILQVFDTGERTTPRDAAAIRRLADRHRIPFRLGVGAFERALPGGATTGHRAWFAAVPEVARSRWYRGVWVFPGGRPWLHLLEKSA